VTKENVEIWGKTCIIIATTDILNCFIGDMG
jgi:hypothetical protein